MLVKKWKVKKTRTNQSTLQVLFLCLNQNDSQTFKSSSCKKKFLQCVCYRCNLLWWMFFVSCDYWKKLFFTNVSRYFEILPTSILWFYLKQVFWQNFVFYVIFAVQCYYQFVTFKPFSYCFEETIGFDVRVSFVSRSVSRLISWYNKQVI